MPSVFPRFPEVDRSQYGEEDGVKIKDIKTMYTGKYGGGERTRFTTYDYCDGNGKIVIVVTYCRSYGNTVWQAVRVSDGAELIRDGQCRPCDNLDDAIDVAGEMITEDER